MNAQEKFYFYHGIDYGSESVINPGSLIINGGFDILQSATHSRDLSTVHFGTGLRNVWDNFKDPFTQINKYGWGKFLGQEVFPTSLAIDKAQYFPNYTLHLIGGGMDSRMMYEWFVAHNVPYPSLMSGLTIATYHWVNEAAENDNYVGPNVDPLADLYIFDIGGVILFSSDAVKEFFSSTLHLTSWPGQPAWNPTFNTLENQSQFYVIKYALPFWDKTSLFYHFGDNGMLGLSFLRDNNESISVSAGFAARELRTVDVSSAGRTVSITLGWIAGIFYDRENSVLASLMASNRVNEKVRLNIYPGVFSLFGFSPGMFMSLGRSDQFIAGISIQYSPMGLAYRSHHPPPPAL
ncbi:MAG: hypothetical protein PHP42_02735 [Bacteroidota bacterium]|nr:hypothetical protein [Bacteroidota bacterium]